LIRLKTMRKSCRITTNGRITRTPMMAHNRMFASKEDTEYYGQNLIVVILKQAVTLKQAGTLKQEQQADAEKGCGVRPRLTRLKTIRKSCRMKAQILKQQWMMTRNPH